jgi:cytochrome c553
MRYPFAAFFLFAIAGAVLPLASSQANQLRIDKTVFYPTDATITPRAYFSSAVQGDLYLAVLVGQQLYFITPDRALVPTPTPLVAQGVFEGARELVSFSNQGIAPAVYPLYMVVSRPNGDVMRSDNWVSELSSLRLTVNLGAEAANDLDRDGWEDSDLNFDGYADAAPELPGASEAGVTTASSGRLLASQCAQCHGPDGVSVSSIDSLRGESAAELIEEFREYAGEKSGIMHYQALGYTDDEIRQIATWFAGLSATGGGNDNDGDDDD